jgi:hypothetical protein
MAMSSGGKRPAEGAWSRDGLGQDRKHAKPDGLHELLGRIVMDETFKTIQKITSHQERR